MQTPAPESNIVPAPLNATPGVSVTPDRTSLIHQIMIVDGFALPTRQPPPIEENIRALRNTYPEAAYRMWDARALREVIAANFEPEVVAAFDMLVPYSFKADLARYCILYLFGGLYVDLGMRCLTPLDPPPGIGIASFRDLDLLSPSWVAVAGGITWAVPRREEFRIAIDYVLENCRNRYYGANPLYPTGPVLFGRALIAAAAKRGQGVDADDQWIGVSRPLTPGWPQQNIAYISPDGTLIALRVKRIGGDLTHLGAAGTNNYNDYWRAKTVYGERVSTWSFTDPAICTTHRAARAAAGIEAASDDPGVLTYGPYIELSPGKYRWSAIVEGQVELPRMLIDVAHSGGQRLTSLEIEPGPRSSPFALQLAFETQTPLRDVEFRTEIFGPMKGRITGFQLEALA